MGFGSQHRHTFASENALPSVAIRLLAIQHLPASGLGVDLEFKKPGSEDGVFRECGEYMGTQSG
ncbi:MAG: hypothetical protein VX936_09815, partial [Planctomycetota bacterium]|nr:hypothetical protein [Planctomycetota bacterium]